MITDKNKKIDLLYEEITYKAIGAAIEVDIGVNQCALPACPSGFTKAGRRGGLTG
jgi:hypothetical protein